jgi:hypothetical protein
MEAEFEQVVTAALLGTERQGFVAPSVTGALGEAMSSAVAASKVKEAGLLKCLAMACVYRAAGRVPWRRAAELPAAAEEDSTPVCGPKAGELLGRILGGEHQDVLVEWLAGARAAGVRAPHRWLPALLDRATAKREIREDVLAAIGRRGRWLMGQNPAWQFDQEGDAREVWQTGSREARVAALGRLRARDPAGARELLKQTWEQETPEDRAKFLATFAIGLSAADEEMLEGALDDKRKEVRTAAAELLARLPSSRLVGRMVERLSPLVSVSKSRGKLVISVKLPGACDKAMLRDGIAAKPQAGMRMGEKQWWLSQMISFVPPGHWDQAWGMRAHEIVAAAAVAAAAAAGEFEEALLLGWARACARNPDADWIEEVVRRQFSRGAGDVSVELLGKLPAKRFGGLAVDVLEAKSARLETCHALVQAGAAFDAAAARALVRRMKAELDRDKQAYSQLWYLLPQLGMLLPVELAQEIGEVFAEKAFEPVRRQVEEVMGMLSFRREVARATSP